ncbi:hypothetical protein [Amycolatopsis sp. NBC_01480]|uniref:hypothetical protein n=1 Tax=Amycolatopsis sp. NBC_01480 TaxID=2903562 RepID=UPI002E2B606E|nr:hypothetical protein [Amycolatopsis sp. NBC_01480]
MVTTTREDVRTGFCAAILLGIGDDDSVDCVAERDFGTEDQARRWIEQTLPAAAMPDWVHQRRHGTAGVFLFGAYQEGVRIHEDGVSYWVPFPDDAEERTADLVGGTVRWWPAGRKRW